MGRLQLDQIPSDGDPFWVEYAKPLLVYLQKPRTNAELLMWRKENKVGKLMLVQVLAWCDNRSLIVYRNKKWSKVTP